MLCKMILSMKKIDFWVSCKRNWPPAATAPAQQPAALAVAPALMVPKKTTTMNYVATVAKAKETVPKKTTTTSPATTTTLGKKSTKSTTTQPLTNTEMIASTLTVATEVTKLSTGDSIKKKKDKDAAKTPSTLPPAPPAAPAAAVEEPKVEAVAVEEPTTPSTETAASVTLDLPVAEAPTTMEPVIPQPPSPELQQQQQSQSIVEVTTEEMHLAVEEPPEKSTGGEDKEPAEHDKTKMEADKLDAKGAASAPKLTSKLNANAK